MKQIAWGASKLLWLQMTYDKSVEWEYVVDDYAEGTEFYGIPIRRSDTLRTEEQFLLTIFAVSSESLADIIHRLAGMGILYGSNVQLYSDLFRDKFIMDVKRGLRWDIDPMLLRYATSFTLNSRAPIHTTICGTWLVLESLRRGVTGDIAEVGAYEGGNALCVLQSPVWKSDRSYLIFDSLEGFPDLSSDDPKTFASGDYATVRSAGEIMGQFTAHDDAKFIKGFVPSTFAQVHADSKFSVVLYDCDLYQPALDTFEFFWSRLAENGIILIHDYFDQPGGFEGVKKATDKFCNAVGAKLTPFWQNTMAVMEKAS